jgi:hypothetical protein
MMLHPGAPALGRDAKASELLDGRCSAARVAWAATISLR